MRAPIIQEGEKFSAHDTLIFHLIGLKPCIKPQTRLKTIKCVQQFSCVPVYVYKQYFTRLSLARPLLISHIPLLAHTPKVIISIHLNKATLIKRQEKVERVCVFSLSTEG